MGFLETVFAVVLGAWLAHLFYDWNAARIHGEEYGDFWNGRPNCCRHCRTETDSPN